MSTENDSIAVDHDVSREAILEAVQKARSNEGFLNTDTPPERDQPAAEDPAEAPDDLAEQPETEGEEPAAEEEAAPPAKADAPPTPEEEDEVTRILEEARKARGGIAAKATEAERLEREARERVQRLEKDAESSIQRKIEEALALLQKDPLTAARKYGVDPDKYALRRAEEEDPTANIVSKVDQLLAERDKRIAMLEQERAAEKAAQQKAAEEAHKQRIAAIRDQFASEVSPEKHPFAAAVWSKSELLAAADTLVDELNEAGRITGKEVRLTNAQLLDRLEKRAAEVAKAKKAELQKALALLEGKPVPAAGAKAPAAAKPKPGMTAAVAGARKTAPSSSIAATEAEERALTLQKIRQLRGSGA